MTARFDAFLAALTALCQEYGLVLATEGYEGLQVWDADENSPAGVNAPDIEDRTKP